MARKGKNQHVVPHPKGWAVRGEGNQRSELLIHARSALLAPAYSAALRRTA